MYNQPEDKGWTYFLTHHNPPAGTSPLPTFLNNQFKFISDISTKMNTFLFGSDDDNGLKGGYDDINSSQFLGLGKTVPSGAQFWKILISSRMTSMTTPSNPACPTS